MRRRSTWLPKAAIWSCAGTAYLLLACLLTWPLPAHLRTQLLGYPGGDTGVYIWNLWIFRHEILRHAHAPFSTTHMLAYTGGTDFALHNFAPLGGLLGAPLIGVLGVVGAFNAVMLACLTLTGLALFGLAGRLGLRAPAAWAAGALLIASPVLTARETAHFSLVIAAALPLFLWTLLRALDTKRIRDAMLVGGAVAAASYSDAYYGIYCAMMGAFVVTWRLARVDWRGAAPFSRRLLGALDAAAALIIAATIAWWILGGTADVAIGPIGIGMRTLYTPGLLLVLILAVRLWLTFRPVPRLDAPVASVKSLLPLGVTATGVCLGLMLPELFGVAERFLNGRLPGTQIFWRSSPRGVDALAYLIPNPNHPWFGDLTSRWLMPPDRPDAFPEFVAAFSLVALAAIAVAGWRRLLPPMWVAFTAFFMALSLGPFLYVGGINTYVIGPWALLRYVPVIGMARSPARFEIVAALGLSLLFAFAVQELYARSRWPIGGRRAGVGLLVVALAFELAPSPRRLYSAAVPEAYHWIAAQGGEAGRLLDLPTGIRDGTSSMGDFSAATLYYQTEHRHALIGGYLSRVSLWRKRETLRDPMLHALIALSEGETLQHTLAAEARSQRDRFLRRSCVRFVVVNKARASASLREFAIEALGLSLLREDPAYAVFAPSDPPACDAQAQLMP